LTGATAHRTLVGALDVVYLGWEGAPAHVVAFRAR
jgi:hypothetical protein